MADHAQVLGSLAITCAKVDRKNEALEKTKQCVGLYRKLEEQRPGKFIRQLAKYLNLLRGLYEDCGQTDFAKRTLDELTRLLERQNPNASAPIVDITPMHGDV